MTFLQILPIFNLILKITKPTHHIKSVVPNRLVATPKWVAEEFLWVANSSLNSLLKS